MIGPVLNSSSIFIGGAIGFLIKKHIPRRVEEGLTPTFSLSYLAIGITMVIKVKFFPVVVLSLIFGRILGELLYLEKKVNRSAGFLQKAVERIIPHKNALHPEEFSRQFSALIILFCASSLGILGSLSEGLSGDYQLLIIKSILDFFTAMIFALPLGPSVMIIGIPQLLIQGTLFFLSKSIMPYMDTMAYADFSAFGGVIMLSLGLTIARIKSFSVVNMVPSLFLIIPFSYLWRHFFG